MKSLFFAAVILLASFIPLTHAADITIDTPINAVYTGIETRYDITLSAGQGITVLLDAHMTAGVLDFGIYNENEYLNRTDPHDEDTDDDRMPDGWEVEHNLDPLVNDAFDDKDGDGFCNWREYLGGSDPDDVFSRPGNITIYIDDDNSSGDEGGTLEKPFDTVQEGVNFAGPGDSVSVAAGLYTENISIIRNITLTGESPKNTFIDGSSQALPVVQCSGISDSTIQGFHIMNGTGAGLHCSWSDIMVNGNIISGTAGDGIRLDEVAENTQIVGNTIVFNEGNGILCSNNSDVLLINNIITHNAEYGIFCELSGPVISYNNIWDNDSGSHSNGMLSSGNISVAPFFVDPSIDDYHLQAGSACVDAGSPGYDFSNEPEPNGGRINLGAYGGTEEAAKSTDFDKDGDVDGIDLAIFTDEFISTDCSPAEPCLYDLNGDNLLDENDLILFSRIFGRMNAP